VRELARELAVARPHVSAASDTSARNESRATATAPMTSNLKGLVMPSHCSSFTNEAEAYAAVDRLLAEGTPGTTIRVLMGSPARDHRAVPVGSLAGTGTDHPVGSFAGAPSSSADAMGSFTQGAGEQRRGGFDDVDRDAVTAYSDGVRRVHVASHHELKRLLADAGLDREAIAADVAALHRGRLLVLVSSA
jgi:hypothetical protein